MTNEATILLASSSPRRRLLLERAGFRVVVRAPPIDDSPLRIRPDRARTDCASVAWFKAAQIWATHDHTAAPTARARWIVAADTVCIVGSRTMGKPQSASDARSMLLEVLGRPVQAVTGVCIVDLVERRRELFSESSTLVLHEANRPRIDEHLARGDWEGRAGGFNLEELGARGWTYDLDGDADCVVGLPMRALATRLKATIEGCAGE